MRVKFTCLKLTDKNEQLTDRMFRKNISWVGYFNCGSIVPEERFVYEFLYAGKLQIVAQWKARKLHRGHGEPRSCTEESQVLKRKTKNEQLTDRMFRKNISWVGYFNCGSIVPEERFMYVLMNFCMLENCQ